MATIEDAFALAEQYAVDATLQARRPYRAMVREFAHGWCVWTEPERFDGPPAPIGSGAATVLDRETGLLAFYPAWSTEQIMESYRPRSATHRNWPPMPRRADVTHLLPGPARIAMALTKDNVTIQVASARGDAEPVHHPLVSRWLAAQPAGELVRGAHRHADMVLLSEVFRRAERAGLTETAQVWDWLFDPRPVSYFLTTHVPRGHSLHQLCCMTCQDAWRFFGSKVHPWKPVSPKEGPLVRAPEPGRFPPQVEDILVRAGWDGHPADPAARAPGWVQRIEEYIGGPLDAAATEAAVGVLSRYIHLRVDTVGPGLQCRRHWFAIGCADVSLVPRMQACGGRLGEPVFPIGEVRDCLGDIVVTASGRIFLIDQAGDWYLGADIDEALVTLIEGRMPRRLREDGSLGDPA
ncbi:SUKH-3 domain-containing protein [Catellatospora sp. NPDC049609]|uniref:SUKH-3 domain-containing protein n=1 Tax=Catellatospora sp. NPDC049609 TaxID=3155505 RepID=UPI00343AAB5F